MSRSPPREPSPSWSSEQDSKNEIVKMLFAIETHEHVLKDFSCAYQGTILLHGRLYVLQRTLCFYSNVRPFVAAHRKRRRLHAYVRRKWHRRLTFMGAAIRPAKRHLRNNSWCAHGPRY